MASFTGPRFRTWSMCFRTFLAKFSPNVTGPLKQGTEADAGARVEALAPRGPWGRRPPRQRFGRIEILVCIPDGPGLLSSVGPRPYAVARPPGRFDPSDPRRRTGSNHGVGRKA